jgi:arginase
MDREVIVLASRIADRTTDAVRGAAELGEVLGARTIGRASPPHVGDWREDLRGARGALAEAGEAVGSAMDAGRAPILLAGDCSVALGTLPAVLHRWPEAQVVWFDAHGDFNTPDTSPSGYLGGMALSGACGVWDPGPSDARVPPGQVAMVGVRDVDEGERLLLERHEVPLIDDPAPLDGLPVFLHLDLDVLDPEVMPSSFAVPGGMSPARLRWFLEGVCSRCEVIGAEITSIWPGRTDTVTRALSPLLGV